MRQGQQNRRGRGRPNNNHSHSTNHNQSSSNTNNRKGQNPLTRSFESTGPDVKIRGNPAHIAEKYMQLARDAQTSGDPVLAENYLQHAEHYNRIILTYREQQIAEAGGQAPNPAAQAGVMPRSRFQSDDDTSDDGDDQQADGAGQIRGQEPQPGLYDAGGPSPARPEREPRADRNQDRGGQDRGVRDGGREGGFTPRDSRDGNRGRDDRGQRDDRPYRNDRAPERNQDRNQERSPDRNQERPQRNFDDRPQRRPVEAGQQGQDRSQERSGRERFGGEQNRGYNPDRAPDRGGSDRGDRAQRFERPERQERFDRGDRPANDRAVPERPERPERIDRGNRFERPDRPERSERYDRHAEPGASPVQAAPQDAASRPEAVIDRPADAFVPRAEVRTEAAITATQPTLDLQPAADAAPTPRAAPRRRAPSAAAAAARFAEAAGGEAPEFLTRPVRRPRRETPVADAEAPAAPTDKSEPE
jgi:Domain of unknown function (DUF4167)